MAAYDPRARRSPALDALPAAPGGGRPGRRSSAAFVRDVWLGRAPRELDLVIEGDAAALARALPAATRDRPRRRSARRRPSGDGWRVDVARGAPRALPGAGRAARSSSRRRSRRTSAGATSPSTRSRSRSTGERARGARRARGPRGADACACSTTRSFDRRPDAAPAPRALRRSAWASRSSRTPRRSRPAPASRRSAARASAASCGSRSSEPDPVGGARPRSPARLPIVVDRALIERALALAPRRRRPRRCSCSARVARRRTRWLEHARADRARSARSCGAARDARVPARSARRARCGGPGIGCRSRRSRSPARAGTATPRGAGSRSCATSRSRSAATT